MKKYRGIFFDWDGTAVISRKAPVEEAVAAMKGLLDKGVKLVIVFDRGGIEPSLFGAGKRGV